MKYRSTRSPRPQISLSAALAQGLAPDGGLYVPVEWPHWSQDALLADALVPIATTMMRPFAAGDVLETSLETICGAAFNFPCPLTTVTADGALSVLELFHGPTAAFKDFGARFLAASLATLRRPTDPPLTILVATSGDTGGAVAAAFHRRPGFNVVVLFPQGRVSPAQQLQLTCWGDNVLGVAVRGDFDDCQALVKAAFRDSDLALRLHLSSANSINLGRLLPQMAYYAWASVHHWRQFETKLSFIVPSGNLGNAMACVWARQIGLPIADIIIAQNANRSVVDFLDTGEWRPRPTIATLASAMDSGNPSNMERLLDLTPSASDMRKALSACTVSDEQIRQRIRHDFAEYGRIWCPHTATAAEVYAQLEPPRRKRPWAIVSTAHPAKFPEIVEPLIDSTIKLPPALAALADRATHYEVMSPEIESLRAILGSLAG
ncbi:MAG: threonine synthase [Steroidobacteraceae bacterium]